MNATELLALATDDDAKRALDVLLKGLSVQQPALAPYLNDEQTLQSIVQDAAPNEAAQVTSLEQGDPRAIRALLMQLATSDRADAVAAALTQRQKLIEPVTTAVVLAGIVLLLSTSFSVEFENVDGKKKLKVNVAKKETTEGLLARFFDLFKG